MYRNLLRNTTLALGALVMSSSLVFAAATPGAVTALDGKGMATVRTMDGKDHQVKAGEGFKVGTKVACEVKNNALECRASEKHAEAPSAPTTGTPAKVTQTPATTSAAPTAAPSSVTPAAGQAAPAPSASTTAPVSK